MSLTAKGLSPFVPPTDSQTHSLHSRPLHAQSRGGNKDDDDDAYELNVVFCFALCFRSLRKELYRIINDCAERPHQVEHILECMRLAALHVSPQSLTGTLPSTMYGVPSFAELTELVLRPCEFTYTSSTSSQGSNPVAARSLAFILLRHYVEVMNLQQSIRLSCFFKKELTIKTCYDAL